MVSSSENDCCRCNGGDIGLSFLMTLAVGTVYDVDKSSSVTFCMADLTWIYVINNTFHKTQIKNPIHIYLYCFIKLNYIVLMLHSLIA